jgi:hypothetical protein
MGGAAQEGEIGGDGELGIGGHTRTFETSMIPKSCRDHASKQRDKERQGFDFETMAL